MGVTPLDAIQHEKRRSKVWDRRTRKGTQADANEDDLRKKETDLSNSANDPQMDI